MVGKEDSTLKERRSSQESNIPKHHNDSGIHMKSSQDSNSNSNSFSQHVTDEETSDLGISILPDKRKDSDSETTDDIGEIENSPPGGYRRRQPSETNGNVTIGQIENSSPRKSLKRSSSLDLEKFTISRRKKSSIAPTQPNYFDMLSDEVMLLIFTYLNKKNLVECSQVSKRWKRISYDDELWMRIDVSSRTLHTSAVTSLLERNPKFLRMSQTHFRQVKSVNRTLRTEYLDLSMAKINVNDLGVFMSHFDNLKKLSLEHSVCDLKVCEGIVQNKKLNCLNLSMCKNVCEHFLGLLLNHCTNLVSLNLSWCNLNAKCLEILCEHLNPNLVHLNMAGCLKNLENRHLELIARRCANLIELDLSDCTSLNEEAIPVIVNHFPKLCTLSLSRCYNIAPREYGIILSSKSSLKYFNIYGLLLDKQIELLQKGTHVGINKNKFSLIARPTVGDKRTSIWGYRVRDSNNN